MIHEFWVVKKRTNFVEEETSERRRERERQRGRSRERERERDRRITGKIENIYFIYTE